MAHLYRLTSPSGRSYIGIAKDANLRWRQHAAAAVSGSKGALHSAIRKHGYDNFTKEILVIASYDYVKDLEIKAIRAFKTKVPHGYNMTEGGEGLLGYKFSDESKSKIAASLVGHEVPKEMRVRISLKLKGYKHTDETRAKMSVANSGRGWPEASKKKFSESLKGKLRPHQTPELMKIAQEKATAAIRGKKRALVTCPHCGKVGGNSSMGRWHFDRCRNKGEE